MSNAIGDICILILIFMMQIVVAYWWQGREKKYMEEHPIQIEKVIVISKQMDKYPAQKYGTPIARERYHLGLDKPIDILADPDKLMYAARYYVTFATEEQKIKKFKVNVLEYEKIREGQKGELTFQGKIYLGFQPRQTEKGRI